MTMRPTPNRGLTLLEVVMATAVLSIAIVGTYSAWVNARRMEAISQEDAMAQAAVNQVISDIRATAFSNIANSRFPATPKPSNWQPGFSGGQYPGATDLERLQPGQYRIYLGGNGGIPGQYWPNPDLATDPNAGALRGVRVSPVQFPGAVRVGSRWYAPAPDTAEMRIILINNENPIEAELGEVAGNQDGADINGDGQISTAPFPYNPPMDTSLFPDTGARPLFPRTLVAGVSAMPTKYRNISELLIVPVLIQVRWWSAAGVPRTISVVTFITDR